MHFEAFFLLEDFDRYRPTDRQCSVKGLIHHDASVFLSILFFVLSSSSGFLPVLPSFCTFSLSPSLLRFAPCEKCNGPSPPPPARKQVQFPFPPSLLAAKRGTREVKLGAVSFFSLSVRRYIISATICSVGRLPGR